MNWMKKLLELLKVSKHEQDIKENNDMSNVKYDTSVSLGLVDKPVITNEFDELKKQVEELHSSVLTIADDALNAGDDNIKNYLKSLEEICDTIDSSIFRLRETTDSYNLQQIHRLEDLIAELKEVNNMAQHIAFNSADMENLLKKVVYEGQTVSTLLSAIEFDTDDLNDEVQYLTDAVTMMLDNDEDKKEALEKIILKMNLEDVAIRSIDEEAYKNRIELNDLHNTIKSLAPWIISLPIVGAGCFVTLIIILANMLM